MSPPQQKIALALLAATLCAGAPEAADLLLSDDRTGLIILRADGAMETFAVGTPGRVLFLPAPGGRTGGKPAAISHPGGSLLFTLHPDDNGRTSEIRAIELPGGESRGAWTLRCIGRFLEVTRSHLAFVAGLKPGTKDETADRWILSLVDLETGNTVGTLALGKVPADLALRDPGDGPARLFVSGPDRVTTFTSDPPGASWFFRSPGDNRSLAVAGRGESVHVLRGGSLVIIDPEDRPRDETGRILLGDDDATTIIPLPDAGVDLAVDRDGLVAAVLHADGRSITWVDARQGAVLETASLDQPADLLAEQVTDGPGGRRIVFLAAGAMTGLEPAAAAADFPLPEPAPAVPAAEVVPPPPGTPAGAAAPAPGKETMEEEPGIEVPVPEEGAPSLPEPPPEEEEASGPAPPGLSGRVRGEVAEGMEILVYGPDNILRLHSRVSVKPDGTFQAPLPAPGRYRVILSAGSAMHVFASPEFRTVVVTGGEEGIGGLDFEVRGSL